jgi:hypothetical protein
MTDDFLRQRRNLFILNGILLFSYLAKVEISKLTLVGISFSSFGNANIIYDFLWIIWGYFIYRFTVYFLEIEKEKFLTLWHRELESKASSKLYRIALSRNPELNDACGFSYQTMKKCDWNLHYQAYYEGDESLDYAKQVENVVLPINRRQIILSETLGVIRFVFITPAVTNYILPLIISIYVFFVAGFSNWEGAFIKFFT